MNKLYENKGFLIVVSFILAFLMWIYVTSTVTDEVTRTFTGVRLELSGENTLRDSKGLVITDVSTGNVNVSISGPRRVVASLNSGDLTAMIDVSKLSQSAYASVQYSIVYPNNIDTSALSVQRKLPESVNFMVSKQVDKEIPVRGSFNGQVAAGYTSEAPFFEPATIIVSGAEAKLKNISYAWVNFGSETIHSSYSLDTGYTLMDEAGNPLEVDGVIFSTDIVKATMPVLEVKDVPLDVNRLFTADLYEENVRITIEPESITLAGDSAILDGLNKISLGTIDFSTFESTYEQTFPITIDNSLTNVTGITEATVTVEILGMETRSFRITNLDVSFLTEGYTAEVLSKNLDVKLRGTKEELEQVKAENLRAVADLTDYDESTGQLLVPVKISVDGFTDIGVVLGPYSISVDIRKEES